MWSRDLSEVQKQENLERLASLGDVAGGIAHDFKNVLSGISGRLSLPEIEAAGVGELHACCPRFSRRWSEAIG